MDNRNFTSGYSGWSGAGSSSSRGSGGFDRYGSMSDGGGYSSSGFGSGSFGQMKRGLSGNTMMSSTGNNADAVIAKINQRLDMLSQLEGGMKGGVCSDRFDKYESFDSRPSFTPRDLYRSSGFGFGHGQGDLVAQRSGTGFGSGGGYDGSSPCFGPSRARLPYDSFSPSGPRSSRQGGQGGHGFGHRLDPSPMGSGRVGMSPVGQSKIPSLLSQRMYPERGAYKEYPGGSHFGRATRGARQRGRKRPLNRPVQNSQQEGQKKRKRPETAGAEPESKVCKTEPEDKEKSKETPEPKKEAEDGKNDVTEVNPSEEGSVPALSVKEEIKQVSKKVQEEEMPTQDKLPKLKKKKGFLERVQFACSICRFRSFYSSDMATHLESKFHKEHFKFLSNQLSKPTADFLQEYMKNKYEKTEQRTKQMANINSAICQMYREQDLTRELGMEQFMRKVEAAHCGACDMFIPMQPHLIQRHLKSPEHNYMRKGMLEQSKRSGLSVARSILNHKVINGKLEQYLKGENPFMDDHDPADTTKPVLGETELHDKNLDCPDNSQSTEDVEVKSELEGEEAIPESPRAEDCAEGDQEEDFEDEGLEAELGEEDEEAVEGELGEEEEVDELTGDVDNDGDGVAEAQ